MKSVNFKRSIMREILKRKSAKARNKIRFKRVRCKHTSLRESKLSVLDKNLKIEVRTVLARASEVNCGGR